MIDNLSNDKIPVCRNNIIYSKMNPAFFLEWQGSFFVALS